MKINNSAELQETIKKLEQQHKEQKDNLIEEFYATYESFKPVNILKNSINKVVHSPGTVDNIVSAGISIGLGLLSKKVVIGKSAGIAKKLLGTAMELGVASLVSKKAASIKSGGLNLLSKIFKPKNRPIQNG
jgi:radical SAM superfamily enzyme